MFRKQKPKFVDKNELKRREAAIGILEIFGVTKWRRILGKHGPNLSIDEIAKNLQKMYPAFSDIRNARAEAERMVEEYADNWADKSIHPYNNYLCCYVLDTMIDPKTKEVGYGMGYREPLPE